MSEKETTTDDAELNPKRYRGETKTLGMVEEMLADFRRYKEMKWEEEEEPAAAASGRPVAEADD